MTEPLIVLLEDAVAGTLGRLANGRLQFEYDDKYRMRADATALSLSMPTSVRTHSERVITPWLWGLLPENNAVLARWAREFHVPASPFRLLGTRIGLDCAGAVRFVSPDQVDDLLRRRGSVKWLSKPEVARRLRELQEDRTSWLGSNFTGQFSLAGAQAKTALLFRDGRWGEPAGALATSHILKPAVAGFEDHDLNEHLCLDAAARAGLVVAHSRVVRFGAETAIVVERYDRRVSKTGIVRIHQEDLCQAMSVMPARKYQSEGGPGPADAVALFRRSMPPEVARDAVARFVDALIWNWVVAGTDAHAKNYSILLAAAERRLAPLYDIASALPYRRPQRDLRLAMRLGSDYRVMPRRNPWPRVARDLGLDVDAMNERVRALASIAPNAFSDSARARDVSQLRRPLPARLVDLVASRSRSLLQLLG
jgi:serine/threonine-protein kinase HipA